MAFKEVADALEKKRLELKELINTRFLGRTDELSNLKLEFRKKEADTKAIEIIFDQLINFIDSNVDARIM